MNPTKPGRAAAPDPRSPVDRRRRDGLGLLPRARTPEERRRRQALNRLLGWLMVIFGLLAGVGSLIGLAELRQVAYLFSAASGALIAARGIQLVNWRERRIADRRSLKPMPEAEAEQNERFAQLLQENTSVNDLLRQQAEASLTNLHRPIEQIGVLLSRPVFIITSLTVFGLWIFLNLDLKVFAHHAWDEPPFFWLQGLIGALSLLVTATVLVSQARQAQLAEQRSQLSLQFALLGEQRSAKIVQLLEELRRDLPNVRNRIDEEAEAMQQPTRPEAILQAMEILAEGGETSLPPAEEE